MNKTSNNKLKLSVVKLDPIIAVKDIEASSKWYQKIFGLTDKHGGEHFSVLVSEENETILCLHEWAEHNHPIMANPGITAGNGLLLYFRTDNMMRIYQNAIDAGYLIEVDIHSNPNSLKKEFSFRDPDGYYLTVTEFHTYNG